jgi:hypothetical protein
MCKMKGCSRPSFVGGLCGFHALQGYYRERTERTGAAPRKAKQPRPTGRRAVVREPAAG